MQTVWESEVVLFSRAVRLWSFFIMLKMNGLQSGRPGIVRLGGIALLVAVILGLLGNSAPAQPAAGEEKARAADAGTEKTAEEANDKAPEKPAPADPPKEYVQLPVDASQKNNRIKISQILRSGKFGPGEEDLFTKYYETYALARWATQDEYNQLPARRKELRNELISAKQGTVHDRLNALALEFLGKMVDANMHPAVRFNAMLAIGELNAREPTFRDPPIPLPETLPVLLDALTNEKQIDAVRLAALIGISRWASLGIPEGEARNRVIAAVLDLANAKSAPGRSAEGHAWMRARAIEVLGEIGMVGSDGTVAKALAQILEQENTPISVRMAASRALGKLNYGQESGLSATEVISSLGELAVEACTQELGWMKKEMERRKREALEMGPGGMGPGRRLRMPMGDDMFMGGPGGLGLTSRTGEEEAQDDRVSRRRLKAWLLAVKTGLAGDEEKPGGVASLAKSAEDKKFATAVTKPIDTWISLLDDGELEDDKMVAALEESLNTYEKLLQTAPSGEEKEESTQ